MESVDVQTKEKDRIDDDIILGQASKEFNIISAHVSLRPIQARKKSAQ